MIRQKALSFFVQFVHFRCVHRSKTADGGFAYILFIIMVMVLVMVLVLVTSDFPSDRPPDNPMDAIKKLFFTAISFFIIMRMF